MSAGRATGLHTDSSHETFYVLEGELLFHVDGAAHRAQAGTTVAIPRGVPHAFLATSEKARFVVLNTRGGHDRFFRAGGQPALNRDLASAPAPDYERTMTAAKSHGVQLLGPPSVRSRRNSRDERLAVLLHLHGVQRLRLHVPDLCAER
jgi:hypothetical protein